jgi:hypothetical protein
MTSIINQYGKENNGKLHFRSKSKGAKMPKIYQKQSTKGLSVLDQNVLKDKKSNRNPKKIKIKNKVPIEKNKVIPTENDLFSPNLDLEIQEWTEKLQALDDNLILLDAPSINIDGKDEREVKLFSTLVEESHKALENLDINIEKMYSKRESDNLLINEGESSYKYNKTLEENSFNIPCDFLSKHKINSVIRTRMVDWMIEVLSVFSCQEETFFLSVNLLDLFLWKTNTIYKNENMHLIGMVVMFIAAKFQEIFPITLKDLEHKVGHDQFTQTDIKNMEAKVLREVNIENLVSTSVYDFCKTYFYDFYYNNKNLLNDKDDVEIYKYIKKTSFYLNKLVVHYEFFYQEKCSIKAIACIVTAVKIVGDCLKDKFSAKNKGIYNDWMLFLIEQGGFDKTKVEVLAKRILAAFQHYQNSKSISRNLNRFTPLSLDL